MVKTEHMIEAVMVNHRKTAHGSAYEELFKF